MIGGARRDMNDAKRILRPDVFTYSDALGLLREWIEYLKAQSKGEFSVRKLSDDAHVAAGLLPMVLAGKRNLTLDTMEKILPHLELDLAEQRHLRSLVRLSLRSQSSKSYALRKIARSRGYQKRN